VRLEHEEDDVLLARARDAFLDAERFGQGEQVGGALALELVEIDQRTVAAAVLRLVVFLVAVAVALRGLLLLMVPVAAVAAAAARPGRLLAGMRSLRRGRWLFRRALRIAGIGGRRCLRGGGRARRGAVGGDCGAVLVAFVLGHGRTSLGAEGGPGGRRARGGAFVSFRGTSPIR
jgi:hypothetical protein